MTFKLQRGKLNIVFGGQAGSEAKGKMSAWLVDHCKPDAIAMTSSPNAGHTVVVGDRKFVTYNLPVGAVMSDCPIFLGPASIINMQTLVSEIQANDIDPRRIHIDPRASIIRQEHIEAETRGKLSDIGSTLQGIGACRKGKIDRKGPTVHTLAQDIMDNIESLGMVVVDHSVAYVINSLLDDGATILAEGTQGFDLDLEHGIDPIYCTSKMINPSMIAAELGVAPSMVGEVIAVIRPYPIRVNNRTGTSGPYADAKEISWELVAKRCGAPETLAELTTTTKLPRRVFEFSWERYTHMLMVCRPTAIALQFGNYLDWGCYKGRTKDCLGYEILNFVDQLEDSGVSATDPKVYWVGTGPDHLDIVEL